MKIKVQEATSNQLLEHLNKSFEFTSRKKAEKAQINFKINYPLLNRFSNKISSYDLVELYRHTLINSKVRSIEL